MKTEVTYMGLEKLNEIRKAKGMTLEVLSELSGIPLNTIKKISSGITKNPKLDTLQSICAVLECKLDDLDGNPLPPNAIPVGEQSKLPIIGKVSAGMGVLAYDDILGYEFADVRYCNDNYFYLHVSGDSMTPEIKDGDLVLVHKQDSVDSGNYAVVVVDEEDGCVKIVKYGKDWIELHSINPYYPVRRFDNEDVLRIRVIGKVIEVKRKL